MTLRFPWAEPPGRAQTRIVAPGLRWLSMPLPFALKQVNLWLLDDADGSLLIDTGVASESNRQILRTVLDGLEQPLQRLLVTHYHPDHIGLAGWLESEYGVVTLISQVEWARAQGAFGMSDAEFVQREGEVFRFHGLDESRIQSLAPHGNSYLPLVPALPVECTTIVDGERLTMGDVSWEVICVGGHSPDMACLFSEELNVLVAADQILPTITPNISLSFYAVEQDPLGNYLDSFNRFSALPDDVLVLPSHGLPFTGLKTRIQQLIDHHQTRFDSLRRVCDTPQTAASVLPELFKRPLDSGQLMFAMGESIAHLRHLELRGELVSRERDGICFFHST